MLVANMITRVLAEKKQKNKQIIYKNKKPKHCFGFFMSISK